jgi:hypothetical protein
VNKALLAFLAGSLLLVAAIVTLAMPQNPAANEVEFFGNALPPQGVPAAPDGPARRQRWVTISFERIRDTFPQPRGGRGTSTLLLNLFSDARFTAVLDRIETTSTGYVWVGHLQGVNGSIVTLAVTANVMSGSVAGAGDVYTIRHTVGGVYVIQQIDQKGLPPELPPVTVPDPGAVRSDQISSSADDGSLIDVLVVYTPAARTAQGGTTAIQSLIDLGISETNQAYSNSGALQRVRLVDKEEISYTESGSMATDLTRLRAVSDGYLEAIFAIRDAYGADVVQLIENSPDACGIAYLMTVVNTSFAPNAFGITHYECVSPNYSFAHEMGHNMGLRHDTYADSATTPFAYSHGYVNQAAFAPGAPASTRWRDIMAYNDRCAASGFNCTRVQYFSNPLNTYNGDAMGDLTTADAVQSLNNTRVTVANFRTAIVVRKRLSQLTSQ